MHHWICQTCGTQFTATTNPPDLCPICTDERQYVGYQGQLWTTLEQLQQADYQNTFTEVEPGLISLITTPKFAIGERSLLLQHPQGNILWDCFTYLDEVTVTEVQKLGGISTIAISHPHYYSTMVGWADRFDAQIYLHEADRQWVMRPDSRITFWSGDSLALRPDVTLLNLGGHFDGGTVLHWQKASDGQGGQGGQGVLLAGDIIFIAADRRWVSFMYSYPNMIPLPAREIERIARTIQPWSFQRLYGAFGQVVNPDADVVVQRSAERYIRALQK